MTPLSHAPRGRMVVLTPTSSHEPSHRPASRASLRAILPPSQRTSQLPSQPAIHTQPASQPAEAAVAMIGPMGRFRGAEAPAEFLVEGNSDKSGKFFLQNLASSSVPSNTNCGKFSCRIMSDETCRTFQNTSAPLAQNHFPQQNSASFLSMVEKSAEKNGTPERIFLRKFGIKFGNKIGNPNQHLRTRLRQQIRH